MPHGVVFQDSLGSTVFTTVRLAHKDYSTVITAGNGPSLEKNIYCAKDHIKDTGPLLKSINKIKIATISD